MGEAYRIPSLFYYQCLSSPMCNPMCVSHLSPLHAIAFGFPSFRNPVSASLEVMPWVGGRSKEIEVNNLGAHGKTFILFGAKMCLCIPEGGDRAAAVTALMLRCEQTCPQVELEALPAFDRPYAIFLDVLILLLIRCVYILCATELPKITETASALELMHSALV